MMQPNRIIISGGPGAGKSTLIGALRAEGFPCQEEAAREVIRKYSNSDINPWNNRQTFVQLVFEQIIADLQIPIDQLSFCDRGLPDCIAYLKEADLPVPASFQHIDPFLYYARDVFILPPWESIYCRDWARQQEFEQAVSLYKSIRSTYQEWGFNLVDVPLLPVKERLSFVLQHLKTRNLLEWVKI